MAERNVLARECLEGGVEVHDQALERVLVARECPEGLALAAQDPLEVPPGVGAEVGVVCQRRVPVGRQPVLDGLVEAARSLAFEALAVLAQERLQIGAHVGLEHGEQLPELDRSGGLARRQRRAALEGW